jgi:glyoxylase-like metal-dependent hydrolase (beta-lactamase superfamily II)
VPRDWFHVAEIEPGVVLVSEPSHVNSWLVQGSERSILIDTGLGVADIAAAVHSVADTPVDVVNSHSHFDHVGGNASFERRAIHRLGETRLAAGYSPELLAAYAGAVAGVNEAWHRFREADREFRMVGPDEIVRPWPPDGFDLEAWRVEPPPPTGLLEDGDVLDLGDRSLRVLHTPGHAPDHVCLLDERAGILIAQDQVYYGRHLVYFEDSSIEDWARTARWLANELVGEIRVVYCAHCLRFSVPPRFLRDLADAGEEVATGSARLLPSKGLFGEPVLAADYDGFAILVPPAAR